MFVVQSRREADYPGAAVYRHVSQSYVVFDTATPENIKEVHLISSKITIMSPAGRDLSFLKSLHTYIVAEGRPDKLLAYHDTITDDVGDILILDTAAEDFSGHIKQGKYPLRIQTVVDEVLKDRSKAQGVGRNLG